MNSIKQWLMATVMFSNDDRLIYKVFAIHFSLKYTEILSKHSNRTYKHDAQFLVIMQVINSSEEFLHTVLLSLSIMNSCTLTILGPVLQCISVYYL